jgi:hypothetical protein
MPSNAILHEAQQLHNVSDRLDALAEQHPLVSEVLITIAGSVRSTATVLEVLVATKIAPLAGLDPASQQAPDFAVWRLCLCDSESALVVEHDVEKRTVDLQAFAVVGNES